MDKEKVVKGFKVFNPDWTCRNKVYTCPGKFEEEVIPSICDKGMHFCKKAVDCFNYYSFRSENKVAEVAAYGDIIEKGDKCCTNKLEIIREIPWNELLEIVNIGKKCTGHHNRGDCNSGNRNSGNSNSRNWNRGNRNRGECNSGDWNSGNCNSGNWNKCSFSNGCFNTIDPKIYLFNKPSTWTYQDWLESDACHLLKQVPMDVLEYVPFGKMNKEEKEFHPEAEITGGYLKILDSCKNAVTWWERLSKEQKQIIIEIPNFDKEIFKEITGIDVDVE
ncbi:MAG: hypothetical protein K1V96_04195 [Lachnospiraceae bacterium]